MSDWNYYSEEAEMAAIGCCFADIESASVVMAVLDGKEFYDGKHRAVYHALQTLYNNDDGIDTITIADQLKNDGTFSRIGGYAYLATFVDPAFRTNLAEEYAQTVYDKWLERSVVESLEGVVKHAKQNEHENVEDLISTAEGHLFGLSHQQNLSGTEHVKDALWRTFNAIEERVSNPDAVQGVPTGYPAIDRHTSGFKPGNLIVIAGRPAMGKTSFAMNVAAHAAITHGIPSIIFSLEMSKDELVERMLSSEAEVDSQKIRTGMIDSDDNNKLAIAGGVINQSPIYLNDDPTLTPMRLKSKLRRAVTEHKIGLAIVDYIQLMSIDGSNVSGSNRNAEISEISRQLKIIARGLEIPIIAISQLNRSPETRDNPRPILSDLRESGAIEQNADIVMFIFREEYYTGPMNKEGKDVRGVAEILLSKQRNGPTGKTYLNFIGEYTKFVNTTD